MKEDHTDKVQGRSRRQFLGEVSCASLGGGAALSSFFNMQMLGHLAAAEVPEGDDYRALVCVFLQGGNDSFNMLVPRGDAEYGEYAGIRRNLALAQEGLLPIRATGVEGKEIGLHPRLAKLKELHEDDKLAFIANVGTLQQPVTKFDYEMSPGMLPDGLFSHSDQQRQWHTSLPDRSSTSGWLGRMSDLVQDLNGLGNFASAISVNGVNIIQSGQRVGPYVIGAGGSRGLSGWSLSNWAYGRKAVNSQLDLEYANLLQKAYLVRKKSAIELNELFSDALSDVTESGGQYGEDKLSAQLKMVHQVIQARESLGVRRQTFFVMLEGWDNHTELLDPHAELLTALDNALSGFQAELEASGLSDMVTTFTASDFGRSLTSNGQGSDHGWGGNQMVMGGAVNGGAVYGEYPDLYEDNPIDVGRGRLIPTTSVDEYFYELACWFGIPRSRMLEVFPNLGRFHNVAGEDAPLGFMKQPS